VATLSGRVYKPLYSKDGFFIFSFDVLAVEDSPFNDKATTVKGLLPGLIQLRSEVPLKVHGKWTTHKKHGRQFKAESWEPWTRSNEDTQTFLQLCVEGFTDSLVSKRFTERYGLETFAMLTDKPMEVLAQTFEGLAPESVRGAVEGWQRMLSARDLSSLLTDAFTSSDHQLILAKFGLEASSIIRTNPYRLMEIRGFGFEKADALGLKMGIPLDDARRTCGAILWALQEATFEGHLFMRRGDFPDALKKHGDFSYERCSQAVGLLAAQKAVVLDPDVGVYLPSLYGFERDAARMLSRMHSPSGIELDPAKFLHEYQEMFGVELSDAQREAVETLIRERVLVLTGLPGTGKTMVIRTFVNLFERLGMNYSLMAPTGIAAKRLSAVTGKPAGTIHRLLGYNGVEWDYGAMKLYPTNAVIVDETSMVDQELFYRLLSALSPDTIIVLVGDSAQLPSVGPGSVIRELMNCPALPRIKLTKIFRQSDKGAIVQNSHLINQGELPVLEDPKTATEFKFVRCSDEEKIVKFIVEMSARLKEKDANFQVLSPKYEGTCGVNNLNDLLRERLNPLTSQAEWKRGPTHFREGDRLMVVKNDYNLGVYNGDVGKFIRLTEDSLIVRIYGADGKEEGLVEFTESEAEMKLRLAYAVTVHKSQGNEFDTILMPIVKAQGRMLQRNLLYTAVTRARKRVWLVGEESAVFTAVKNDKVVNRNTVLASTIAQLLSGVEGQSTTGVTHGP
jgi:exodeoxyribonuclease V alpha subunit